MGTDVRFNVTILILETQIYHLSYLNFDYNHFFQHDSISLIRKSVGDVATKRY